MLRSAAGKVAWVGRATVFLVGLAVVLAVVLGVATAALAAVPGDPFKLGKFNSIDRLSVLAGSVATPMLKVDNNGTGTALNLEVGPSIAIPTTQTVPPMTVNSQVKVRHLNADKVDGRDAPIWAVVSSLGGLDRSHGATSSRKISSGQYEVVFERSVSGCAHSATIGPPSGQVSVSQDSAEASKVTVFTTNSAGTLSDRSFHLVAVC